jgi:hypothetical protein
VVKIYPGPYVFFRDDKKPLNIPDGTVIKPIGYQKFTLLWKDAVDIALKKKSKIRKQFRHRS